MKSFSSLFRTRDTPKNSTPGSNYAFFMGGSTVGKAVTERTAMQMTVVYSCVRITFVLFSLFMIPSHLLNYQMILKENPSESRRQRKHRGQ